MSVKGLTTLFIVLVLAQIVGCQQNDYVPVTGQVYYNDEPLEGGVIMFQPGHGPPARGTIEADGTFVLTTHGRAEGARLGLNSVRVSHREAPHEQSGEIGLGKLLIPARYASFTTSSLTADVKASGNEPFVFYLTD